MKFVLIFGPHAVGKMTVGEELAKITPLRLFHNHMTIELVTPFFGYGSPVGKRLVHLFRQEIFEAVSQSDLYGLIFTFTWAFNEQEDWDYVDRVCSLFESRGGEVFFVELESGLEERLARNRSPHRLEAKPTKRNIEWSDRDLVTSMDKYRLNSLEGEITRENYIRIDNTDLEPDRVAERIRDRFGL